MAKESPDVVVIDSDDGQEECSSPELHFEPIIHLPPIDVKTLEEDEEEILRLRAKLFRFDSSEDPAQWKERGTGDVKFLKHKEKGHVRLLMRRDKTFKVCANHFVLPQMNLKANCGSERAWVWSTPADFADDESKAELLAIRFGSAENAQKFKKVFDESKQLMVDLLTQAKENGEKELKTETEDKDKEAARQTNGKPEESEDTVTEKLGELTVKDKGDAVPEKGGTGDSASQNVTPTPKPAEEV
ncbi:ran-specific GTPase-activating protein-like [Liolophura sinensis]|uniref:ran-specific GTPase-activating protein-like n=1 Tax=Liolophura sinensis TaxID=3198878 RepID=UPI0031586E73